MDHSSCLSSFTKLTPDEVDTYFTDGPPPTPGRVQEGDAAGRTTEEQATPSAVVDRS